jgi:ligand-binding sensor domain-containing protein
LWISENGKGLLCFDSRGKKLIDLQKAPGVLKINKIMDVVDFEGKLWMVSDGEGVLTYAYDTGAIVRVDRQYKHGTDVSVNSLLTLYVDPYNNMWLGSIRGGLLGVRKIFVNVYGNAPLLSKCGLSDPTVISFFDEGRGEIWVGTDG